MLSFPRWIRTNLDQCDGRHLTLHQLWASEPRLRTLFSPGERHEKLTSAFFGRLETLTCSPPQRLAPQSLLASLRHPRSLGASLKVWTWFHQRLAMGATSSGTPFPFAVQPQPTPFAVRPQPRLTARRDLTTPSVFWASCHDAFLVLPFRAGLRFCPARVCRLRLLPPKACREPCVPLPAFAL